MKELSKECIEAMGKSKTFQVNNQYASPMFYAATEALTNPELFEKANLVTLEDALGFAKFAKHHTSTNVIVDIELFTIYKNKK